MRRVIESGHAHHDEDVDIHEVLGLSVAIARPRLDDPLISALGDARVISRTLDKFSRGVKMPDRPFTYGSRIYDYHGVDQFDWMVQRLRAKRETKSATIGLLVPGDLSQNLPCLTTVDAKIRLGKLELQFFFRSQNIFGRQYANLLALARLQSDIAERCAVETGTMRGYIASAHIYDFDMDDARRIVSGGTVAISDRYYTAGPRSIRPA
jgi:thymidylate synthase